jgi:hypothetical protein
MTLTGPSPRAPGETLGPASRTRQRRRLSAVPFLEALLGLHLEYPMRQLEMLATCCSGGIATQVTTSGAQCTPAPAASQRIATLVPARSCLPPADSLGTWVRGTLASVVLELRSSLKSSGNGCDAAWWL